jgi:hypothetical protein
MNRKKYCSAWRSWGKTERRKRVSSTRFNLLDIWLP